MDVNLSYSNGLNWTSLDFLEEHDHQHLDRFKNYLDSSGHGYLTLGVCLVGLMMNTILMIVLTRKQMRSPTNLLLGSISVADTLTILVYTPKITVTTLHNDAGTTLEFAYYKLVFAHVSLLSHTISVWLTVCLCLFRCLILKTQNGKAYTGYLHTSIAILSTVFITTLMVLPNFLLLRVNKTEGSPSNFTFMSFNMSDGLADQMDIWYIDIVDRNSPIEQQLRDQNMFEIQMWIVAVMGKIVPCLLLTIMSAMLIHKLWQVQSKYKKVLQTKSVSNNELTNMSMTPAHSHQEVNSSHHGGSNNHLKVKSHDTEVKGRRKSSVTREQQTHRATYMLLTVVITFILAEFPIALLLLLSQLLGDEFFNHTYLKVAGIFDLLIIINSSINFVIYCSMSEQFRASFVKVFCQFQFCTNLLHKRKSTEVDKDYGCKPNGENGIPLIGKSIHIQIDLEPSFAETSCINIGVSAMTAAHGMSEESH